MSELGKRYGHLIVSREVSLCERVNKERRREFVFICDCGVEVVKVLKHVKKSKLPQSCGCKNYEYRSKLLRQHGQSGTRHYKSWQKMKERCNNPSSDYYSDYGGRGISYCDEWETFIGFWKEMAEGYSEELELDRIDPNGNYCKENCKWSTESHQAYNQRKRKTNTSGRTGVYEKKDGKFWAEIQYNGETEWLGTFSTFEEASQAREEKEIEYYGYIKD